ncbi:DUF882 domain-containing protein [Lichenihabitans sp. Uapishka_5]|uniref:DUF882 domain-containing protein n=1 Tax=Lichenihabitans sp. Uapishka_5 TaxID=3037302 RepID=UPI0029E80C60|nr:DUF882 domain-containing protein [Lichenihabitans sp. Uapishka_5]MDX7949963.1 DUF882 domain-containing protein [Lichenihabitans sp. Uapishka_5]
MAIVCGALVMPGETEDAVANGDTRTIQLYHVHTKESITATYLVNGAYDQAVLEKLNWFLRDWRRDEPTKMDPRLFDTIWEVYRESGSHQPIEVMSAYRSPETNAMLRRRTRGVAEHSQHILGKAMDQHYFDVPMSKIREIAMRLQRGGVGFYPTAGTPFVHMDVGGVRHWPRMSYDQLSRLFPDGKTVHIPSNGQPLPGYEEARAELEARGDGSYPTATEVKSKGFFAWLFGSGDDEQDDAAASRDDTHGRGAPVPQQRVASAPAAVAQGAPMATAGKSGDAMAFSRSEGVRAATLAASQQAAAPAPVQPAPAPDARLALAMSMQQAEAPQPYETAPAPAAASAAPPLDPVPTLAVPAATLAASGLAVPLPPNRPTELADAAFDMPLPPTRPSELTRPIEAPAPTAQQTARLNRADGINALLTTRSQLPSVITQGTSRGVRPGVPPAVLAYAGPAGSPVSGDGPSPVPMPVPRPTDLVSARLDRSNFRSLTSGAKSEKSVPRSAMGSSVVGIRAAARASSSSFAAAQDASSFGSKASDLATDRFSGAALKPNAKLVTTKKAESTSQD